MSYKHRQPRQYHFISGNHVSMFFTSLWWEKVEHPRRDIYRMVRKKLREEFGPEPYIYRNKPKRGGRR